MSDRHIPQPPAGSVEHVRQESDAVFNWAYDLERPAPVNLYEKAKTLQWNASTDIDWSIPVDPEAFVASVASLVATRSG